MNVMRGCSCCPDKTTGKAGSCVSLELVSIEICFDDYFLSSTSVVCVHDAGHGHCLCVVQASDAKGMCTANGCHVSNVAMISIGCGAPSTREFSPSRRGRSASVHHSSVIVAIAASCNVAHIQAVWMEYQ